MGENFGKLQSSESDYRNQKGKIRNKIRSIANKAAKKGNHAKAERITKNNLGRIKWNQRESSFKGRTKTLVFTATVQLMHDAIKTVAFEDLTDSFASNKKRSRRTKRNLNSWCKGIVADALQQVSSRVGCTIIGVSAAYTSQLDSRHGILMGVRDGDKFTCFDGKSSPAGGFPAVGDWRTRRGSFCNQILTLPITFKQELGMMKSPDL